MKKILSTSGQEILVDDIDYPHLNQHRWQIHRGYARTRINGVWTKMHRLLLGLTQGDKRLSDHINRIRLDNRRCNIRIANTQQNAMNTAKKPNQSSQFKGVYWDAQHSKWRAQIRIDTVKTHLGYYTIEELAALAYDRAAAKHFGDYAVLNF